MLAKLIRVKNGIMKTRKRQYKYIVVSAAGKRFKGSKRSASVLLSGVVQGRSQQLRSQVPPQALSAMPQVEEDDFERWYEEQLKKVRATSQEEKDRRKKLLEELLDGMTPEECHKEIDWGPPRGNEVW